MDTTNIFIGSLNNNFNLEEHNRFETYNLIKRQSFPIWINKLSKSKDPYEIELSKRIKLVENHENNKSNINMVLEEISIYAECSKINGKDYYIVFGYDIGHKNVVVIQNGVVALFDSAIDCYGEAKQLQNFFINGIYSGLQEMNCYIQREPEQIQFDSESCSVFTIYMIKSLSEYFRRGGDLITLNDFTECNQMLLFQPVVQSFSKQKQIEELRQTFLEKFLGKQQQLFKQGDGENIKNNEKNFNLIKDIFLKDKNIAKCFYNPKQQTFKNINTKINDFFYNEILSPFANTYGLSTNCFQDLLNLYDIAWDVREQYEKNKMIKFPEAKQNETMDYNNFTNFIKNNRNKIIKDKNLFNRLATFAIKHNDKQSIEELLNLEEDKVEFFTNKIFRLNFLNQNEIKNEFEYTSILFLCLSESEKGKSETFKYLLNELKKENIDINSITNSNGETLLTSAIRLCKDREIIELLIDNGIDIDKKDVFGKTALDYANFIKDKNVISYLEQKQQEGLFGLLELVDKNISKLPSIDKHLAIL